MKDVFVVKQGNEVLGIFESFSEAKKAKLKLEAQDFIDDKYEADKYSMWYYRAE